ncbi:M48 family metalloprotease [Candidatus Babeliales bacterium]|nr:M48 family metalloprotease [Candidatus Babeliales bacterium]
MKKCIKKFVALLIGLVLATHMHGAATSDGAVDSRLLEEYNSVADAVNNDARRCWDFSGGVSIAVCEENAPTIYGIVKKYAERYAIPMPAIFLAHRDLKRIADGAEVEGLTPRRSSVLIGPDLLRHCSLDDFEAVIAHELAHIKCRHKLKMYGMYAVFLPFAYILCNFFVSLIYMVMPIDPSDDQTNPLLYSVSANFLSFYFVHLVMDCIRNCQMRYSEKEADLKALSVLEKPECLVKFFNKELARTVDERFEASIGGLWKILDKCFRSHPEFQERIDYCGQALEDRSE